MQCSIGSFTSVKDLNTSSTLLLRTEMFAYAQPSHEVSRWHCLPFKHGKHLDVSHRLSLLSFLSLFPSSAFVSLFLSFTFSFPSSHFSPEGSAVDLSVRPQEPRPFSRDGTVWWTTILPVGSFSLRKSFSFKSNLFYVPCYLRLYPAIFTMDSLEWLMES